MSAIVPTGRGHHPQGPAGPAGSVSMYSLSALDSQTKPEPTNLAKVSVHILSQCPSKPESPLTKVGVSTNSLIALDNQAKPKPLEPDLDPMQAPSGQGYRGLFLPNQKNLV